MSSVAALSSVFAFYHYFYSTTNKQGTGLFSEQFLISLLFNTVSIKTKT
jgi:hypothetical protein